MSQEEKLVDKNDVVLIAFFADEAAAEKAIDELKLWDKNYDHIKLGAIGTISKEGDKIVVSFSYQREIHLAGPGYLTLKYNGRSKE